MVIFFLFSFCYSINSCYVILLFVVLVLFKVYLKLKLSSSFWFFKMLSLSSSSLCLHFQFLLTFSTLNSKKRIVGLFVFSLYMSLCSCEINSLYYIYIYIIYCSGCLCRFSFSARYNISYVEKRPNQNNILWSFLFTLLLTSFLTTSTITTETSTTYKTWKQNNKPNHVILVFFFYQHCSCCCFLFSFFGHLTYVIAVIIIVALVVISTSGTAAITQHIHLNIYRHITSFTNFITYISVLGNLEWIIIITIICNYDIRNEIEWNKVF